MVAIREKDWNDSFRAMADTWREHFQEMDVTPIFVKMGDPEDFKTMFAGDDEIFDLERGYPYNYNVSWDRAMFKRGFMPFAKNVVRSLAKFKDRDRIRETQESADRRLLDIVHTMVLASPTMRMQFIRLLKELNTVKSLCPISQENPHAQRVRLIERAYPEESSPDG